MSITGRSATAAAQGAVGSSNPAALDQSNLDLAPASMHTAQSQHVNTLAPPLSYQGIGLTNLGNGGFVGDLMSGDDMGFLNMYFASTNN